MGHKLVTMLCHECVMSLGNDRVEQSVYTNIHDVQAKYYAPSSILKVQASK